MHRIHQSPALNAQATNLNLWRNIECGRSQWTASSGAWLLRKAVNRPAHALPNMAGKLITGSMYVRLDK